jgi:hypothetical protein
VGDKESLAETDPDDTQIARLQSAVNALKRDNKEMTGFVVFLAAVVFASLVWLAFEHDRTSRAISNHTPAYPSPSPADTSEHQLLASGRHCYGGPEEFAVARERALAAIDRIAWAIKNLPSPPEPAPYGWDVVPVLDPTGKAPDPNCFEILHPLPEPSIAASPGGVGATTPP